ncbi:MAG TPA: hypothetical protein DCZ92_12455 [Elusimicrobia bacterium]|nr:MAG: hypothetical protein A2016_02000 [Elusimicrobia bacterium GWF2_62_30]HBA61600.1 hypothetical protein [Elusimicrobiota bacterium]
MKNTESERPFLLSKDVLDTTNSVAWFFMDAFWMLGLPGTGVFFIFPTVLTGLGLLYIEKRPAVLKINLAINCWIWMNTMWMLSDAFRMPGLMLYAKLIFGAGVLFMLAALLQSGNIRETFSHFRRFRTFRWMDDSGRAC